MFRLISVIAGLVVIAIVISLAQKYLGHDVTWNFIDAIIGAVRRMVESFTEFLNSSGSFHFGGGE